MSKKDLAYKALDDFVISRIFTRCEIVVKDDKDLPLADTIIPLYPDKLISKNLRIGLKHIRSRQVDRPIEAYVDTSNLLIREYLMNLSRIHRDGLSLVPGEASTEVKSTITSYYSIHRKLFYKTMRLWLSYKSGNIDLNLLKFLKNSFTNPKFHSYSASIYLKKLSALSYTSTFLNPLAVQLGLCIPMSQDVLKLNINIYNIKGIDWSSFQSSNLYIVPSEYLQIIETNYPEMMKIITFNVLVSRCLKEVMDAY